MTQELKGLDESEAASILDCSVGLMRKWRLFQQGPRYYKAGRLVRYRLEDLRAFIESNMVEPSRA